MKLGEILNRKGWGTVNTEESINVETAARIMCDNRVGSAVIMSRDGGVAGIVTERDILRHFAEKGATLGEMGVRSVMSRKPRTGTPETRVEEAMQIMTEHRFRHMPVLDGEGRLVGLVSLGDLVKARLEEKATEAENLREYIAHS
ncbi:MAG TPA: CBS domain-containing protein [Gammaproteobacteria bacterium]|nr:CBS domain-containing protein [Gammaproteobacteria bacterium]